ncbi:MAG: glutamate synthase subunit alpha, partial [Planctomycetes bacterium]|nr:glutamate synthase subunit alpha [Planctomycetota bacterium]
MSFGLPEPSGLYDPAFEHDACGVGFVANIHGEKTHAIISKGIEVLINLTHRGAVGSDPETGDGAGLLFQLPDEFFRSVCPDSGINLPEEDYAVGMVFLPTDATSRESSTKIIENVIEREGFTLLGWREVPNNPEMIGRTARSTCPVIKQFFLSGNGIGQDVLEQKLYVLRRCIEKTIQAEVPEAAGWFNIPSLSSRTLVYKGLMLAHQVPGFYPDLNHELIKSALVVVHQRYSTNTFPTWPLAQPFRFVAHNGEINTLRGNINNMRARYSSLKSETFSDEDIQKLLPIIIEGGSDSACFDNVLELLVMNGRSLAHSLMMMVPEAWGVKYFMGTDRRAFCEYHSMFMEPWDGPAALVCTDGDRVCATLDRNGLRPSRYTITKQGMIVLASEVGVLDIPPEDVEAKGRLSPGLVIVVDTKAGRVMHDEAVKAWVCRHRPYRRWLLANRMELRGLFNSNNPVPTDRETLTERQQAFGYTREDLDVLLLPMARDSMEPINSMGDDTPLAVLSQKPQLLFNYFKQLFAQVTNPPIDPIREQLVMSLTTYLGPQGCILNESPEHARMLKLTTPIMLSEDVDRIRGAEKIFRSITLDMTFPSAAGPEGLAPALESLCQQAEQAAREGCPVIILSDRTASDEAVPIPSLLATAAVNHHLTTTGLRTRVSVIVESGEPREVMHFALLLGYGASAISPYLALETVSSFWEDGLLPEEVDIYDSVEHYIKAIEKGLLKIFSKMGISTLRSYRGAQIFEALGLSKSLVNKYFTNTPTRIGGLELTDLARESLERHKLTYHPRQAGPRILPSGGRFKVRRDGERHLWTPDAIRFLQQAVRTGDQEAYNRYTRAINNQGNQACTLRSLFDFTEEYGVPLAEVEPESEIIKRFVTGAMSFGSISQEAHETIAVAMNRLGCKSNSGEGGEARNRFLPDDNGDNRCSATKQVASGRFGVTAEYLMSASEIQIKISQGAKPG